jgi:sugar lactone lactonase YvrE
MRKLFLVPLVVACTLVTASAAAAKGKTVALFDPDASETPESVQIDRQGNAYVSLALTGEIRKIAPDGTQSTLARLPLHADVQPCENALGAAGIAGLALDYQGNVYVGVNSCRAARLGIWKVTPDGQRSLLAPLPGDLFPPGMAQPNGIAYHRGWLYVADSSLGLVWRVHADGQSPAEVWSDDELLAHPPNPQPGIPGPNGLQIFDKEVYVSVSSRAHVVAIPIKRDGSAGRARVHVDELGFDDFAFDVEGNLYGTTNFVGNMVVRVTPDGRTKDILTADDGLDGPSAAAFGVCNDANVLYITNAAFPFFPGPGPERRPSLMRLRIGIPGEPRP